MGLAAETALRGPETRPETPEGKLRREPRRTEDEDGGAVLACAVCLRPITTTGAGIEAGGAHEHTFTNPHGFRYRIGCFARVEGCIAVGEPSAYWSWFPGYRWQIEICEGCSEHLGWLFRSSDHGFHGLILDRLVELQEGS